MDDLPPLINDKNSYNINISSSVAQKDLHHFLSEFWCQGELFYIKTSFMDNYGQ